MRRSLLILTMTLVFTVPTLLYAADPCAGGSGQTTTQGNFVPLACYKGTALDNLYGSNPTGQDVLATYLNNLFKIILSAGAIVAVIRLVWAGYLYMGTDMWSKKGQAREVIKDTMLGLLLLLGTYLILYQINPDMLNLNVLKSFQWQQNIQDNKIPT